MEPVVLGDVGFQGAEREGVKHRVDAGATGIVFGHAADGLDHFSARLRFGGVYVEKIAWRPMSRMAPAMRSAFAAVALRSR